MTEKTDNRLAVWPNRKREKATHPHLRGEGSIDGGEVWVSAWFSQEISEDDRRLLADIVGRYDHKRPLISISVQAKERSHNNPHRPEPEDIPF